jgi:hypothetical protein
VEKAMAPAKAMGWGWRINIFQSYNPTTAVFYHGGRGPR